MSAVVFLLAALFLATTGSLILWLKFRNPSTLEHSIQSFQREMRALAPDPSQRLPYKKPGDDDPDDAAEGAKTEAEAVAAPASASAPKPEAEAVAAPASASAPKSEAETGVEAEADEVVADEVEAATPSKPAKISMLRKFLTHASAPGSATAAASAGSPEPAGEAPAPIVTKVSLERVGGPADAARPKVSLERVGGPAAAAGPKVSLERVGGSADAAGPKVSLERRVVPAVVEAETTGDDEAAAAAAAPTEAAAGVAPAADLSEAPDAAPASDSSEAEPAKVSLVREQPVRAVPQAAGGRVKSKPKSGNGKSGNGKGGGPAKSSGKAAREREPQDR